jgi:putative GTP pyrophosphokinase
MDQSELLVEFDSHVGAYDAFAEKLRTLVTELLSGHGLKVHSVTARVKSRDSFATKIAREGGRYATIADVTDLAGVRIITYFADDVDRIAEVVRGEFTIDTANSVDKRNLLDPDRFGYLSLHYVITLPPARVGLGEYRRYAGLKAEIQIRSILQHAWAEIEHDLGYKSSLGVPRDVRRQFSRLAGLLEIADKEFSSIREALTSYEQALPSQIERTPEAVLLDKASLKAFIIANEYLRTLDQKIADFAGGDVTIMIEYGFEFYLKALHFFGLKSVADLEAALREREVMILRFAGDWLKGSTGGVSQAISLLYLSYVLLGETGDMERTTKFLTDWNIAGKTEKAEIAKRILETYRRLRDG